jgi:hypothetical protein
MHSPETALPSSGGAATPMTLILIRILSDRRSPRRQRPLGTLGRRHLLRPVALVASTYVVRTALGWFGVF